VSLYTNRKNASVGVAEEAVVAAAGMSAAAGVAGFGHFGRLGCFLPAEASRFVAAKAFLI
jgi:hypothetical protein